MYPDQSMQPQPAMQPVPPQQYATQPEMQQPQQAQQPPQPSAAFTSALDGTPLINASTVARVAGVTIFSYQPCVIEWTTDNRIRIVDFNRETNQIMGLFLEFVPAQLTKIVSDLSFLHIHVNGQVCRLDFAGDQGRYNAAALTAIGPGLGLLGQANRIKQAQQQGGLNWWYESLRAFAPHATARDHAKNMPLIIGLALGGTFLLIILIGVIAALAS